MHRRSRCRETALLIGLFLSASHSPLLAQDKMDAAIDTSVRTTAAGRGSQQRIDRLSDDARALLENYRAELWKGQQLQLYIRQLEATISGQEKLKTDLADEIQQIEATKEALVPLLLRMVDALEQFIALDLPFLAAERNRRIERLRKILADPELQVSEQYRRVLEAFRVEADYGRSLQAYRGPLESGRETRLVDFLRVGRTALYFLSLDGTEAGLWDRRKAVWKPVATGSLFALKQGIRVAREQATPELLALPLAELSR